jgi:glycosyltransferase involved in cell wall biosynthesis
MSVHNFSVLIAVCGSDKEEHFEAALESIYNQSLVAKQVVLIADGPLSDKQNLIICNYEMLHDSFMCVRLPKNQGLAAALNFGLAHCEFELVVRMDSDDVCENNRFSRQLEFMKSNPNIAVSSGKVTEYSSDLCELIAEKRVPKRHKEILSYSKYRNPINHMACIFRKSSVLAAGGYPEQFRKAQDFALWAKMLKEGYEFANIDDNLVNVRAGEELFERRGFSYFYGEVIVLRFLNKIDHINTFELLINLLIRIGARLAPKSIKKIVYKILRNLRKSNN